MVFALLKVIGSGVKLWRFTRGLAAPNKPFIDYLARNCKAVSQALSKARAKVSDGVAPESPTICLAGIIGPAAHPTAYLL